MLRWTTAGESHGPALIALLEGLPSGVPITTAMIADALQERRGGYGRGARQKFEQDKVRILAGVRHGLSTGAPIAVEIGNSEWPKWEAVMSADPVDPSVLQIDAGKGDVREMSRNRRLTAPRPGHADLAGMVSYRLDDARDVLERASARETAARVALGAIARSFLAVTADICVLSHVVSVGPVHGCGALPRPEERDVLRQSPLRTTSEVDAKRFAAEIDKAKAGADTIGGVAEVVAWNVPLGLGSHVSSEEKLDARIAAALMSIQSAKAVEIGDGFTAAAAFGSSAHDEMVVENGTVSRLTNRAGGIEGGTSNGQVIRASVGFKPISTVPRGQRTVDLVTGTAASAFHQRSDTAQVVPGAVIAQAMVELVLAQALTERFGGRSVDEVRAQLQIHLDYVQGRLRMREAESPNHPGPSGVGNDHTEP